MNATIDTNTGSRVNNGRIDVMGKTNLDVFTLYDQIPISETTSDFREALTGTTTTTMSITCRASASYYCLRAASPSGAANSLRLPPTLSGTCTPTKIMPP